MPAVFVFLCLLPFCMKTITLSPGQQAEVPALCREPGASACPATMTFISIWKGMIFNCLTGTTLLASIFMPVFYCFEKQWELSYKHTSWRFAPRNWRPAMRMGVALECGLLRGVLGLGQAGSEQGLYGLRCQEVPSRKQSGNCLPTNGGDGLGK